MFLFFVFVFKSERSVLMGLWSLMYPGLLFLVHKNIALCPDFPQGRNCCLASKGPHIHFLIFPSPSPQRLVFYFSGELEGMTEREMSILAPCPYLPVHSLSSSLSTVVPKGSHPALCYRGDHWSKAAAQMFPVPTAVPSVSSPMAPHGRH